MKNIKRKIGLGLVISMFMFVALSPSLIADTTNVSIKWYIPSDLGLEVQYPTGLESVEFRPTEQTFGGLNASYQDVDTGGFRVTNTGNVDIDIDASFTTDLPTNVTYFNISADNTGEDYKRFWVPANDTSDQTIFASLSQDESQSFWCWSSGVKVENTTYPFERTYQLTFTAS